MADDMEDTWENGFVGHETEQMRRLSRLSFQEKLAWLEAAHLFVLEMKKAREVTIANKDAAPSYRTKLKPVAEK